MTDDTRTKRDREALLEGAAIARQMYQYEVARAIEAHADTHYPILDAPPAQPVAVGYISQGQLKLLSENTAAWVFPGRDSDSVPVYLQPPHPSAAPTDNTALVEALPKPDAENASWTVCLTVLKEIRDDAGEWAEEALLETVQGIALAVQRRFLASREAAARKEGVE